MTDVHDEYKTTFGTAVPESLSLWAQPDDALLRALATYSAQLPRGARRASDLDFPGTQGDQVWLVTENQGGCIWLAPAATGSPVYVAADHLVSPVLYADSLTVLVDGWLWDGALLGREPLLQAQALPGDEHADALLSSLTLVGTSWGWPCPVNRRYESSDGLQVLVWMGDEQWDWWVSAPDPAVVSAWLPRLRAVLGTSLWSNDGAGEALLG